MRSIRCCLGMHNWNQCKCDRCGKTRVNASHLWDGCKCRICGHTRDAEHEVQACKCVKCGSRVHSWHGCYCVACGRTRRGPGIEPHFWKHCTCEKCGEKRDSDHVLENCKCTLCGKEVHSWGYCSCPVCDVLRKSGSFWGDLICVRCRKESSEAEAVRLSAVGHPPAGYDAITAVDLSVIPSANAALDNSIFAGIHSGSSIAQFIQAHPCQCGGRWDLVVGNSSYGTGIADNGYRCSACGKKRWFRFRLQRTGAEFPRPF